MGHDGIDMAGSGVVKSVLNRVFDLAWHSFLPDKAVKKPF